MTVKGYETVNWNQLKEGDHVRFCMASSILPGLKDEIGTVTTAKPTEPYQTIMVTTQTNKLITYSLQQIKQMFWWRK